MDCKKYLDKCYTILDLNDFTKLDQDATCCSENKFQKTLKKMKYAMPQNVYSKFFPSGSCLSKFYQTAKLHKLSTNNIDDLTLCPIVSNIDTANVRLQNTSQNHSHH